MKICADWQRLECDGLPIYVNAEKPDWFVPSGKADVLLHKSVQPVSPDCTDVLDQARLFSQLSGPKVPCYQGRGEILSLSSLKECWFHLTNECNLACRHCLFGASPGNSQAIGRNSLLRAFEEAKELGCTLFYFTGGEPLLYPDFFDIVSALLEDRAVHVVVLTNGLLLEKHSRQLQKLPVDRLHLQISLDGVESSHDALRGSGAFGKLMSCLDFLHDISMSATLSVAVNSENIHDLPAIVRLAAAKSISNIHLLWHFVRGKGSDAQFVDAETLWQHLKPVLKLAGQSGITIDNVETLRSQVFSVPGTRHDLSNSGWESLAVGPDEVIYPSPALVGVKELHCGTLDDGLDKVWRNSSVLDKVRRASLVGTSYQENELKFLIGGGDIDHSYIRSGEFAGHDPYVTLYNNIVLWLISQQARKYPQSRGTDVLLKMGDVRYDCPDGGKGVALTHCNCVISLSGNNGAHGSVREFYGRAATLANEDIVNPLAPALAQADFIPMVSRKRSYGCGSPVHDAEVKSGETLVDLGSGSGVECFLAAEMVGRKGRVFGIDMTDEMLALARSSKEQVVTNLGFDNVSFKKGFLEAIPLEDGCADVVISNCVINLSPDKRSTLLEAFRILKDGGRLVVSDIVTDEQIPVSIKNNEQYRGECLGGAMQQEDLMAMLRSSGFSSIKLIKRFPYRHIGSTSFYSLTFIAFKPGDAEVVDVIYRGPFGAVYTENGVLLLKGKRTTISLKDAHALDDSVFIVDESGSVTNFDQGGGCCGVPPESGLGSADSCCSPEIGSLHGPAAEKKEELRQHSDCLVCGSELRYFTSERPLFCYYCAQEKNANASCQNAHFVCDACHQHKGVAVMKKVCTEAATPDMITLMKKIRKQPAFSMHGPEHHAMVPGVILSAYRARGGRVGKKDIITAIERGSKVPGGVCGFWGSCGAAVGAGIAFAVIVEASPLTPKKRQMAQGVTARILAKIAEITAGRCCQRETVIALKQVAAMSKEVFGLSLLADDVLQCDQYPLNRECVRKACPFWQTRDKSAALGRPIALQAV